MNKSLFVIFFFTAFLLSGAEMYAQSGSGLQMSSIVLPKNYHIEVYTDNVPNAREMDFAEDGTLFAGSMQAGNVYAITTDKKVHIIDNGLEMPTGLDYYKGDLYVSEVSRILVYRDILKNLDSSPEPIVLNNTFPSDKWHGWKFIRFGPDNRLYVPVGVPCNACLPEGNYFGNIIRMKPDGTEMEIFAEGLRNSEGFDWDPKTDVIWFTDNGRDNMGDDFPPDELNKAIMHGLNFGFPYINGTRPDPEYFSKRPKSEVFTVPSFEFPAHVAPLGMRFYKGDMFDDYYKSGIFVAEHGSWNRSKKIGYRVTFVHISDGVPDHYETFASGWLQDQTPWGRPADVQVGPDGALYVSDDLAGAIYRIYYKKTK